MAKAKTYEMTTTFTLTHNLYSRDEVVLAWLTALLKKQDINECYYWLNELCISISVSIIRKIISHIYYDFYYALNDNELDTLDLQQLNKILFQANSSPLVCLLCQTHLIKPKFIYLSNKKKDMMSDFMRAVTKTHYDGISYHAKKLLTEDNINSEQIVKALCLYYKSPFINKSVGMRDDLQYVMAVYARLHLQREQKQELVHTSLTKKTKYSIPSTIASFKLKRWYREETEQEDNIRDRLINDPHLVALGLSLTSVSSKEILLFSMNYIKAQLNADEVKLFTGLPNEETMLELAAADWYTDILAEQKAKQQLWLEQIGEEYSPDVKLIEMLPSLATVWLQDVFPILGMNMLALVKYKMLDNNY